MISFLGPVLRPAAPAPDRYGFFLSSRGGGRLLFCDGGGVGPLSGVTTLAGSLGGRPLSPDFCANPLVVTAQIIATTASF